MYVPFQLESFLCSTAAAAAVYFIDLPLDMAGTVLVVVHDRSPCSVIYSKRDDSSTQKLMCKQSKWHRKKEKKKKKEGRAVIEGGGIEVPRSTLVAGRIF